MIAKNIRSIWNKMKTWQSNFIHNRFNHLLTIVALLFVVSPFLQVKEATAFSPVVTVIYTVMVIAVLSTIITDKKRFYRLVSLKLLSFALDMLVFYEAIHIFEYQVHMFDFLVRIFFVGLFIKSLFNDIFSTKNVTADTVKGWICIYVFIGVLWGMFYKLTYELDPTAFSVPFKETWSFYYFSFSTLLTVGYGDITPTGSVAMMLTVLEALIGQLFLVIFRARLVGLQLKQSLQ